MKSSVSLLSIIVALCLGHVLPRGLGEHKIVSFDLEVIRPWHDCLKQLENNNNNNNNNTRKCSVDLFARKSKGLEKLKDNTYILPIGIGEKIFKVHVDTGSSRLWVFGTKRDKPDGKKHPIYQSKNLGKYFDIDYLIGTVKCRLVTDTIYFGNDFKAQEQEFGSAIQVSHKMYADGVLGLNMGTLLGDNPAITAMKAAKMKPIFSLYLKGIESGENGGEITFGGVNEARLKSQLGLKVDVIGCESFILQMDEVRYGNKVMCTNGGKEHCKVLIDSGSSHIVGPKTLIETFNAKELNVDKNDEVKCDKMKSAPSIIITFGSKSLTLEADKYIQKIDGECYTMLYGRDLPGYTWIFGDPFLIKFVTEYNVEHGSPSVTFYEAKH